MPKNKTRDRDEEIGSDQPMPWYSASVIWGTTEIAIFFQFQEHIPQLILRQCD
jgi:hypothetical protein